MTPLLLLLAVAFAWSMGAHYTGACMGMPRALGVLSARSALLLMAPLCLLGATFASHAAQGTVAHGLTSRELRSGSEVVVVAVAFTLTTLYNWARVPTSTIQILVFSLLGTALGVSVGVHWQVVGLLAGVWLLAPLVAACLGYGFTRLLDMVPHLFVTKSATRWLGLPLVIVGAVASFAMGGNDVVNAAGPLVGAGALSPLAAGALGGVGLAIGVLTWGRPLLQRVAFDVVRLDPAMATAAQGVQAIVVLVAVSLGLFTSMNQALIGAMAGAGLARGRNTMQAGVVRGIARGWVLGPAAAIALSFLVSHGLRWDGVQLQ